MSIVLQISSSGPSNLSLLGPVPSALVTIRNVISGESNVFPSELAYFFKIISLTSSTKSSARICTSVADAFGRFTQIFRCNMAAMFGTLAVKWS